MISETAANMVSSLHHCLTLFHQQEEVRILQLKQEKEKCRVLEESLNVLAKEHHQLEQSVASHLSEKNQSMKNFLESNDDDEFHDAFNEGNVLEIFRNLFVEYFPSNYFYVRHHQIIFTRVIPKFTERFQK